MDILTLDDWNNFHRENYQSHKDYNSRIDAIFRKISIGVKTLSNPENIPSNRLTGLSMASNTLAKLSLESLLISYTAGLPVKNLASFFPTIVEYWNIHAKHHINFHESSECDGHLVPHLELITDEYWEALQLVCFSILFAQPEHLPTIVDILAYENDEQDALLDKLVSPWLPDREISNIYLRQLPYRKLDKVFAAKEEDRPKLMSQYLDEWYGVSKREPYHDRHKSSFFPGYWSLEAATVTVILRIDDSSYRDKPYYPKDLVDYARSQYTSLDQQGNTMIKELR